ncbi:Scr1 family TA system antitoxin-like transcriptional regulator [Streptomyces sp. NPDC054813]
MAELEQQATLIQQFALSLVPGVLQTDDYARALFCAYRPNYTPEELDEFVVIRTKRRRIRDRPCAGLLGGRLGRVRRGRAGRACQ